MIELPFGKATDKLDARFTVGILLPCLVFSLLAVTALMVGHGLPDSQRWWRGQSTAAQALLVTAGLGMVTLVSWVLAGQTTTLLRWAAGYWTGAPGRWLLAIGQRWHRRRHAVLRQLAVTDATAREILHLRYPNRAVDVLPTRLGNTFAAIESYGRTRYGVDLVLVWPRLYAVLPDRMSGSIASAKAEVELQLVTCTLAVTYGFGVGVPLALLHAPVGLLLGWLWGCALVAYASYRSAVTSAVAYGEEVRCALDLHRLDVLTTIGIDIVGPERDRWRRLAELWFHAIPLDAVRADPPEPVEAAPAAAPEDPEDLTTRIPPLALAVLGAVLVNVVLLLLR